MTREDEKLVRSFENLSLDLKKWTQRTHVAIAFIYLRQFGFSETLNRLRSRIKAFNAHNQIEESATSGYNETTTVAMLRLVDAVMTAYDEVFPVQSSREFCDTHPQLMSKHVLRFFYTPERRTDPKAKYQFIEPDLAPLPKPKPLRGSQEGGGQIGAGIG